MTGFGYAEETGNGVFFFFCETRAGSEGATLQQNSSASFCFEFRAWPSVTAEVADENTAYGYHRVFRAPPGPTFQFQLTP